jgi:hypothetical protein
VIDLGSISTNSYRNKNELICDPYWIDEDGEISGSSDDKPINQLSTDARIVS